jgi:hypothetical protein
MDVDEGVALVDHVTLMDIKFYYTARELSGYPHRGGLGLPLEYLVGLVDEQESDDGEGRHHKHHAPEGYDQFPVLFFLFVGLHGKSVLRIEIEVLLSNVMLPGQ